MDPIVWEDNRRRYPHRKRPGRWDAHVFDIRRSKSVDQLWRRFEYPPYVVTETADSRDDVARMTHLTGDSAGAEKAEAPECAPSATSPPGEQPQSLLEAFEAELAHVLSSTETPEDKTEQPKSSYDGSPDPLDVQNARPVVRDFVEKTVHYINCQASGISCELAARMPGLRRQLSEAQRDLPESLRELLQGLFANLEHSVATYGAVPSGRQFAEEVVQAGGPIAENAVESLQTLASEFGHAGRTLFAAFENEFGRNGSNATSSTAAGPSTAPVGMTGVGNRSSPKDWFIRHSQVSQPRSEVRTLFIGNVGYKVTAKMIFDVFHSNGFMLDVGLPLDTASNGHVGFGYLRFLSASDANLAMQKMQGVHIDGHAINLEYSETDCLSPCMHHSYHRTMGYALLDSMRGIPCECGIDHGVGDWNIETLAKPAAGAAAEQCQPTALQHGSSSPDDLSTVERATTSKPLDAASGRHSRLHSEPEMRRFPPVSQFEAQHVAEQWRARAPGFFPNPGTSEAPSANDPARETSSACQTSSPSSAEARSSQSEHRSLHNIARNSAAMDTWARLDRRARGRASPPSYRDAAESFPGNATQPHAIPPEISAEQAKDAEIENCISSLVSMGFGSPEQGGRARLGVYAAAAKGNVYDAVGMIEEEQKIYADLRLD